jgi:hypothetical protein
MSLPILSDHRPITPTEVTQALRDLHPNKDDWTVFERSNMERALYKFWTARKDELCSPKDSHQIWIGLSRPSLPPADGLVCATEQARHASSPLPVRPAIEEESQLK